MKIEKSADAQLGRSFEFALPKEWSRQEQIQYTADYIKKTFVDKGMCADWSIHDKGDGNPHVHLLLTFCIGQIFESVLYFLLVLSAIQEVRFRTSSDWCRPLLF